MTLETLTSHRLGERLVGILGTVSMRRRGNPLPASSAPAIYRQYMKYGSYLVEGKMPRDFISCVIHVMAESERDGNDCLWDYGGMRNHHKSNLFMLPAVIRVFSWPDYCICDCNHCWVFLSMTPSGLVYMVHVLRWEKINMPVLYWFTLNHAPLVGRGICHSHRYLSTLAILILTVKLFRCSSVIRAVNGAFCIMEFSVTLKTLKARVIF